MARQLGIAGTERPHFEEIDSAAERLRAVTEEFAAMKLKKESATDALIAAMKKHGVASYRDDDAVPPLLVTLRAGPDRVKVKVIPRRIAEGSEDPVLEAEGDRILAGDGVAAAVRALKDAIPEGVTATARIGNGPEHVISDGKKARGPLARKQARSHRS